MAINFFNSLAVGTNVLYVDTLNDRVGIGTSTPDTGTNLHVLSGTSSGQIKLTSQANTQFQFYGDGNQDINYGQPPNFPLPGGDAIGQIRYSHGSNYMAFKVNNAEMVRFASNNNVGIGTTSPSEKLDVSGTIQSSANEGKIIINSTATNGKEYQLISIDTGNLGLFDGTAYRLWVSGSGNVGIGTTSPSHNLTINSATGGQLQFQYNTSSRLRIEADSGGGSYYAAAGFYHRFFTSGVERLRIDSSGKVGIGTTSPANNVSGLHISVASSTDQLYLERTGSAPGRYYLGTGANSLLIVDDAQSAERLRINSSGNVGIGVSNPLYKLDVSGTGHASNDFRAPIFYDNNNTGYYVNPASTSNLEKLQVDGLFGSSVRRITNPGGATYLTQASSVTGGLLIQLPTARRGSNTMMQMTINVYQYNTGRSFQLRVGGYNYNNTNSWVNVFAYLIGDQSFAQPLNVRFGDDGTRNWIMIGETNTVWSYPQFQVTDFQAGYSGVSESWSDGWATSIVTSIPSGHDETRVASSALTSNNASNWSTALYVPSYYDSNNTSYYVDPASTGIAAYLRGDIEIINEQPLLELNDYTATNTTNLNAWVSFQYNGTEGGYVGFGSAGNSNLYLYNYSGSVLINGSSAETNNSFRAPIFYDSNNTAYYADPAGTSVFNGLTVGGSNVLTEADPAIVRRRGTITSQDWNTYIDGTEAGWYQVNNASGSNKPPAYTYGTQLNFSTSSANKLQIYAPHNATDGNGVWIRTGWNTDYDAWREIPLYGMAPYSGGDLRASVFYDSNNTGYYVNPASTSVMNDISNGSSNGAISYGYDVSSISNTIGVSNWFRSSGNTGWYNGTYAGGIYMTDTTWIRTYNSKKYYTASTSYDAFYTPGGVRASLQMRAPIYYDENNTAYYADPAGTSVMNAVALNGDLTVAGSGTGILVDTGGHASVRLDRASTSYDNNLLFYTAGALKWRLWQDGTDNQLMIRDDVNSYNSVVFNAGGSSGYTTFNNPIRLGGTGTANELDDYEEGTWTATWGYARFGNVTNWGVSSFGGNSWTGRYVKIGRLVHCTFAFSCTSFPWSANTTSQIFIIESSFPFALDSTTKAVNGSYYTFPGFSSSGTSSAEVTGTIFPQQYASTYGAGFVADRGFYANFEGPDSSSFVIGPGLNWSIEGSFQYYTAS